LVLKISDKPWDWKHLSSNPSITMNFILTNPDKDWYWIDISSNPSITPEFIMNNLDKPWYWGRNGLSRNLSITSNFIWKV
jgi:hypothetical protein